MQKPGTNRVTQEYETLKGRFARWAAAETRIHGLAVLGSRARSDGNADEWSDLNLLVITESAQLLARHTDWLADVGKVWVTYLEESTVGGVLERRVLFDGGFDVDILMLSAQQVERFAREEGAAGFLECMNVLVDKNGLLVRIASTLLKPVAGEPLSREQFAGLVNDFWFHSVWTMKKLSRGELWVAKWCCDSYMKQLLLKMVETHAQVVRGKGNDVR